MQNICYYCQEKAFVDDFENPHTKQSHLTCEKCKRKLSLYLSQRVFYSKLLIFGPIISIVLSIVSFVSTYWKLGILFIALAFVIGFISFSLHDKYIRMWQQETGAYVDRKKIIWCKTCSHFNKISNYERTLWQSHEIINDPDIPCKIVKEVRDIWSDYFKIDPRNRTLYPKDCTHWVRK